MRADSRASIGCVSRSSRGRCVTHPIRQFGAWQQVALATIRAGFAAFGPVVLLNCGASSRSRYASTHCKGSTSSQLVCVETGVICDEADLFDVSSQDRIRLALRSTTTTMTRSFFGIEHRIGGYFCCLPARNHVTLCGSSSAPATSTRSSADPVAIHYARGSGDF